MKKQIETYHVYSVTDTQHIPFARFTSNEEAKKACPFAGGYGGDIKKEVIEVYETFEEYMDEKIPSLKRKALEKLTKEERYALGL